MKTETKAYSSSFTYIIFASAHTSFQSWQQPLAICSTLIILCVAKCKMYDKEHTNRVLQAVNFSRRLQEENLWSFLNGRVSYQSQSRRTWEMSPQSLFYSTVTRPELNKHSNFKVWNLLLKCKYSSSISLNFLQHFLALHMTGVQI